ncbi:MAG: hypothetical protein WCJ63_05020, partial [Actinomycetes bacterium]
TQVGDPGSEPDSLPAGSSAAIAVGAATTSATSATRSLLPNLTAPMVPQGSPWDKSLAVPTAEQLSAASKTIETAILEAIGRDEADQLPARAEATADAVISILGG